MLKVSRPAQSILVAFGSRRLAQLREGRRDRRDPDRDVEQEHRLPAEAIGQGAADERPDRDRDADRRPVGRHRHRPLAAGGELLRDQRQRDGEHDRAADPLHRAVDVQHRRAGRQPRRQRRDGEDPEADAEDAPPAEPVGQRARGQDQGGQREGVGVDHPLKIGEAGVQVLLDRRQRGVDDGDVEQQHEGRHRDRDQSPPFSIHLKPS